MDGIYTDHDAHAFALPSNKINLFCYSTIVCRDGDSEMQYSQAVN